MAELNDILDTPLLHDGVKGMKWGVVRWRKTKTPGLVKQQLGSMKRERQWKKVMRKVGTMNTKDVSAVTKRIGLENEYKKLSKTKVATSKDKQGYRNREKMSDQELTRKVGRLRAVNALNSQVELASKEQRDFGMRVVKTGGSLGMKYALNKNLSVGDVYESVSNPNAAKQQAIKTALDYTVGKAQVKINNRKVKK